MSNITDWIRRSAEFWRKQKTSRTTLRKAQQEGKQGEAARRSLVGWIAPFTVWVASRVTRLRQDVCECSFEFLTLMLDGHCIREANAEKGRFHTFVAVCLKNFIRDHFRHRDLSLDRLMEEGAEFPARPEGMRAEGPETPVEVLVAEVLHAVRRMLAKYPLGWEVVERWVLNPRHDPHESMSEAAEKLGLKTRRFEHLADIGKRMLLAEIRRVCEREERRRDGQ